MALDENKLQEFKQKKIKQGFGEPIIDRAIDTVKREAEEGVGTFKGLSSDIQSFLKDKAQSLSGATSGFLSRVQDLPEQTQAFLKSSQQSILPGFFRLTQPFGNRSSVEKFSGGVNLGADFATPKGTPVALPRGQWVVTDSFGGAREGVRSTNRGFGNSVEVMNALTGERLRFSHLLNVGVKPGQVLQGGQVVATTGNSGNTIGKGHVSILYIDQTGKIRDVLDSQYRESLFG